MNLARLLRPGVPGVKGLISDISECSIPSIPRLEINFLGGKAMAFGQPISRNFSQNQSEVLSMGMAQQHSHSVSCGLAVWLMCFLIVSCFLYWNIPHQDLRILR